MEDERPEELGKRRVWELEGVMGRGSAPGCHLPRAMGHGNGGTSAASSLLQKAKGQGFILGIQK